MIFSARLQLKKPEAPRQPSLSADMRHRVFLVGIA